MQKNFASFNKTYFGYGLKVIKISTVQSFGNLFMPNDYEIIDVVFYVYI